MALQATRRYIEAITTGLSDNNVRFKEGKGFYSNIQTKTITLDMQELQKLSAIDAKGVILHETAHIKHTTATTLSDIAKKHPSQMQDVYNVFEDIRIEQKMITEYGDFASEALTASSITGCLQVEKNFINASKLMQVLYYVIIFLYESNYYSMQYKRTLNTLYYQLDNMLRDKINSIGYVTINNQLKQLANTQDLQSYVDTNIYPIIQDLLEPETEKKQPQYCSQDRHGLSDIAKNKPQTTIPTDQELNALLTPFINTLSQKLKTILQENSMTRYTGSHNLGKLLSKNTYKVLTNDHRIFSRKTNPDIRKYTISLLLDESGSMKNYNRHTNTYIGAYLLNTVCKKLGFTINLIGVDGTSRNYTDISQYRSIRGGGNDDLEALIFTRNKLNANDNNIIFILTDGKVNVNPKTEIAKLHKLNAKIIAIGLGEADKTLLSMYYDTYIAVKNVEDLPREIISVMQKLIHRL